MCDQVTITTWNPKYRDSFISLNREWIERYFRLEECDYKLLGNPEGEILDKGGEIFFALLDGKVVGCCALVHHPQTGEYELAKMAVSPDIQGQGIGHKLGTALISYARSKGISQLFLEANTKLEASIKLYHKLGFAKVEDYHPAYSRCNLYMEKNL